MSHVGRLQDAPQATNRMLQFAASLVLLGALLHLLIPIGGPSWYAFFGAPPQLVAMAQAGTLRPVVTCIVIAVLLTVVAAYGCSGAGVIRRLPLRTTVLALVGIALTLRGLGFIPLWRPDLLARLCGDCDGASPFLIVTSLPCLFVGVAYLSGARRVRA